jgi:hypothetical protein
VLEHVSDEPAEVRAEDGRVILRCGDGFACALSADAAVITSDRLFRAGLAAKRQEMGPDSAEDTLEGPVVSLTPPSSVAEPKQ